MNEPLYIHPPIAVVTVYANTLDRLSPAMEDDPQFVCVAYVGVTVGLARIVAGNVNVAEAPAPVTEAVPSSRQVPVQ